MHDAIKWFKCKLKPPKIGQVILLCHIQSASLLFQKEMHGGIIPETELSVIKEQIVWKNGSK